MYQSFAKIIRGNKYKLFFLSFLIFIYLLFIIISSFFDSLQFFLIVPISISIGYGLTIVFRKAVPLRNIITFLVYSSFWGLFLNSALIFLLGSVGMQLDLPFYLIYLVCVSFFNLYFFIKKIDEIEFSSYFRNLKLDRLDILWSLIFIIFFFLLINIGLENYFPNWDSFTYWAIDTKYIFQNSVFRDYTYNLITYSYLPFYPLQLNYVYLLYGEIVEQYSSLLTLYYGLLGVTLLFSFIIGKGRGFINKSLLLFSTFIAIYSFMLIQGVLFSQYADVFLSVVILFYFTVLFYNTKEVSTYWSRILLLVFLSVSLYLTKSNYSFITIALLIFIPIYDFKFIRNNVKKLLSNVSLIVIFILIALFLYFVNKYSQNFSTGENLISYTANGITGSIRSRFLYFFDLLSFVLGHIPLFSVSSIVFILLWILFKKQYKEDLFKIFVVLLVGIFPVAYYTFTLGNLVDMSLLRYLGLIFFALAYLFSIILPEINIKDRIKRYIIISILLFLPLLLLLKSIIGYGVDFNFTVHSGQYKNFIWQRDFYLLSEKVKKLVPENTEIMLVDEYEDLIGNTSMPIIILRYYLSDYSVGFQYRYPSELWYSYVNQIDPDFLLIYTYDKYWYSCNNILEDQKTYLIKFDEDIGLKTSEECFFEFEDVIPL